MVRDRGRAGLCAEKYDPTQVIWAVKKRDGGCCTACGFQCERAKHQWKSWRYNMAWDEWRIVKPDVAEYDHIIPFCEGGLTVVENMRTLCSTCHKERTKAWRKEKSKKVLTPRAPRVKQET